MSGLLDAACALRDLLAHIPDITGYMLGDASIDSFRALSPSGLPAAKGPHRPQTDHARRGARRQALHLWLDVDGQRMQDGVTATLVFCIAPRVSYISQFMSLQPGDIIPTGTRLGVGMGQTVTLGTEGPGTRSQTFTGLA